MPIRYNGNYIPRKRKEEKDYWFKQRRYGYGATPITWKGWAVTLGFVLYLVLLSFVLKKGNVFEYFLWFIIGLIGLIAIIKKKTEGGLEWRWG